MGTGNWVILIASDYTGLPKPLFMVVAPTSDLNFKMIKDRNYNLKIMFTYIDFLNLSLKIKHRTIP